MVVYGTRPEAIKLGPVVQALRADSLFDVAVVSTGQHGEMLTQLNQRFGIVPDYDLALMKSGQSLNELVSRTLMGLDEVFREVKPDCVIVQGDTSTAATAAISAFHLGIKVVHLEAGLRTNNLAAPFPEEGNRKIITQIASLHLAPTSSARSNLLCENVSEENIVVTGNTVIDSLLQVSEWDVSFDNSALESIVASDRKIVMMTVHRRENLDALDNVAAALVELAEQFPQISFVLPLHPNPAVRETFASRVSTLQNVLVIDPLPYDQFTALLKRAYLIMTDSGGVQEEAPSLGVPVLLMRNNTERPEGVASGAVKLVGTDSENIVSAASELLRRPELHAQMAETSSPYGDGKASARVVAAISALEGIGERVPDFRSSTP